MKLILTTVVLLLASLVVADESYEAAVKLIKLKNYKSAKVLLLEKAKKGATVKVLYALGYTSEKLGEKKEAVSFYKAVILLGEGNADASLKRLKALQPDVAPVLQKASELQEFAKTLKSERNREAVLRAVNIMYSVLDDFPLPPQKNSRIANIEKALGYRLKRAPIKAKRAPFGAKAEGFKGHRYMHFDEQLSWNEAYAKCKELGGYLVCVTSKEEAEFIAKLTPRGTPLGLHRANLRAPWQWITGEKVDYLAWGGPEPNGGWVTGGKTYRPTTIASGTTRWADAVKYVKFTQGFVCEWE